LNSDSRHTMRRRVKISISLFKMHSKRKISKFKIYLRYRKKFSKRGRIMRLQDLRIQSWSMSWKFLNATQRHYRITYRIC
jgi:hypothetical protein